MTRLRRAQARYDLRIVSVTILHPLQPVPVIVIRSDRKLAIARATPAIIDLFDPRHVTKKNPSGYAYEAYFFEARDRHGMPYLGDVQPLAPAARGRRTVGERGEPVPVCARVALRQLEFRENP
jgi:hypothetical protein